MKLTLGKKLGLGFSGVLALTLLGAGFTYRKSADVRATEELTFAVRIPQAKAALGLQRDLNLAQNKGRQSILAATPAEKDHSKLLFDEAWRAIDRDVASMEELAPHAPDHFGKRFPLRYSISQGLKLPTASPIQFLRELPFLNSFLRRGCNRR
jgi:hypothetical protein